MRWFLPVLILLLSRSVATAQPADCRPPETAGAIPLQLDLSGQPGVPSGASGEVTLQIPVPAPGALACDDAAPPAADVLRGPPARDLLDGPGLTKAPVQTQERP